MAFLSEILSEEQGIPKYAKEEASECFQCGKEINKGGMWAMNKAHIGICKECATTLLDLYIDTLLDTGEIKENDDIENVKRLTNDIISRYQSKKEKKIKLKKNHI